MFSAFSAPSAVNVVLVYFFDFSGAITVPA